jgi:hypothetical protein
MKILSFGGRTFSAIGIKAGLPQEIPGPEVSPQETALSGTAAVPSAPLVGVRAVPVTFQVLANYDTEPALSALLGIIDVLDTEPRELVGQRADGTLVSVEAFGGSWMKLSRNSMTATFWMREPSWRELVPTTWTKTFGSALDHALPLPLGGEAPVWPAFRLQPTAQRTAFTAAVGWRYQRQLSVTSSAPETLYHHPFRIDLGSTTALVAGGKALSSGNDLRIIGTNGKELRRVLKGWNTGTSYAWVILPSIAPAETVTLAVIYGNSAAGTPPTFAYDKNDPYQTTVLDLDLSTNTSWRWSVQQIAGNHNEGIWYLESGIEDHRVPGSWDRAVTYRNMDDFAQDAWTSYTISSVGYGIATFSAFRYKRDNLVNFNRRLFDGVSFHCGTGITQVHWDLAIINQRTGNGANLPTGRAELWARQAGRDWSQNWVDAAERTSGLGNTVVTVGPRSVLAGTTPALDVKFSVGPYDTVRIPRTAVSGRHIEASFYTFLTVTLSATVAQSLAAEEEVYHLSGIVRIGGGQAGALAMPRDELVIGPSGRFVLLDYNTGGATADELRIETDGGKLVATAWTADGLTRRGEWSWAVAARRIERVGGADVTRLGVRPVLRPQREVVTNTTFDAAITGWQGESSTAGVTAATSWNAGTLQIAVTGNSGGTGGFARARYSTDVPVEPGQGARFSADVQTSHLDVIPELFLVWINAAGGEFSEVDEPDWTPAATGTVYRRSVGGVAPLGAVAVRYRVRTRFAVSSALGTVKLDNVSTTPNELTWADDGTSGAVKITVDADEGYY